VSRRYIGIVGTSYCGSTTLSRLFAAVEGVASVGECHWLLDDYRAIAKKAHGERAPWCGYCATHGKGSDCEVLEGILRRKYTDKNLLPDIADELNADVVVVSEKAHFVYDRILPTEGMDAVLLHRHPRGMIQSLIARDGSTRDQADAAYTNFYMSALEWCRRCCKTTTVVSFESLLDNTQEVFSALCDDLELPDTVLPSLGDIVYHHIYGNTQAHQRDVLLPKEDVMIGPAPSKEALDVWKMLCKISI